MSEPGQLGERGLAEKSIVITGGGNGLGAATTEWLLARGARVVLVDVDANALDDMAQRFGDRVLTLEGDVTDDGFVATAVETVVKAWGPIDGLVNNAGIHDHDMLVDLDKGRWLRVLSVNLLAPFGVSCAILPHMTSGSAIVNISSVQAAQVAPCRSTYCVSKAALESLTKMQAIEWADRGVRVNAVAPGYVDSKMLRDVAARSGAQGIDVAAIERRTPMNRLASKNEIASAVAFLLNSELSGYMTGHILDVDGGWKAYGYY